MLGGSTALIVTGALLTGLVVPVLLELEPPDEQPATTTAATATAAMGNDARKDFLCTETSPPGESWLHFCIVSVVMRVEIVAGAGLRGVKWFLAGAGA